jgi:hypothetical protein
MTATVIHVSFPRRRYRLSLPMLLLRAWALLVLCAWCAAWWWRNA